MISYGHASSSGANRDDSSSSSSQLSPPPPSSSSSIEVMANTSRPLEDNVKSHTSHRYFYEQLGAPSILYRQKPSYNSLASSVGDGKSTPAIPEEPINSRQVKTMNFQQMSKPIDAAMSAVDYDSIFPTQPWSRKTPRHSVHGQIVTDAKNCVSAIRRADRLRMRRFFKSRGDDCQGHGYGHDNDHHHYSINRVQVPPTSQNDDILSDNLPVDQCHHHLLHQQKYDSSNYIFSSQKHLKKDLLTAAAYRRERMHSSIVDGYCAPFSMQSVRYALGDERELPLTRKEERKRNFTENNSISINRINNDDATHEEDICDNKNEGGGVRIRKTKNDNSNISSDGRDGYFSGIHNEQTPNDAKKEESESYYENDSKSDLDVSDTDTTSIAENEASTRKTPHTLKKHPSKQKERKRIKLNQADEEQSSGESSQFHGNCISLIPCICSYCRQVIKQNINQTNDESDYNNDDPNYFLLHPRGQCVSVSPLILPHGAPKVSSTRHFDDDGRDRYDTEVDVGGRILQIDACFDGSQYAKNNLLTPVGNENSCYFIVRTPMHCSFVMCSFKHLNLCKEHHQKQKGRKSIRDKDVDELDTTKLCSGLYEIQEIQRVCFDSSTDDGKFYELLHMTTKCNSPTSFGVCTSFAIVSNPIIKGNGSKYLNTRKETNIIHHVQINDTSSSKVQQHCISKLHNISQIEYSSRHPMVLWAAARQPAVNSSLLIGKGSYRRPMMGYGNSLYSIDLRCNQSNFMWSPSQQEFMMDGIHSISGLLTDSSQPNTIYAKSLSSGGRLYEIDIRMPCRTIFTWDLAGLSDDFTASLSPFGIYGSSVLMTRPINLVDSSSSIQLPVLCANQNPGAYGIQLFQRPWAMPRFQTSCLDMPMTSGLGSGKLYRNNSDNTCFATSTSFQISESDPLCGLVSFYTNLSTVCNDFNDIDYKEYPAKALCVISATSVGDLCSHTLIATPANEERHEQIVEGNRVGSCAVKIPRVDINMSNATGNEHSTVSKCNDLCWTLKNWFPVNSQSISKQHVASRSECRKFQAVPLQKIPQQKNKSSRIVDHDILSLNHPPSETYMGDSEKKKTPALRIKAQYIRNAELLLDTYNVQSDTLKQLNNSDPHSNKKSEIDLTLENLQQLKELW